MLESLLNLFDTFKEHQISKILHEIRCSILSTIQGPYFSAQLKPYFENTNKEGEPFTNFANEPRQITQIKEVINCFYHGELAFKDLETVNLRNGNKKFEDISQLYYHTIEHAYKASYLITHLDIDLYEIFGNEINQLLEFITLFKKYTDSYAKNAAAFTAEMLKQYPAKANKLGLISGIAVDQMRPDAESIDYSFLTQFSVVLPGYIEQLTANIQQYSSQITTFKPTLDQAKLDALQKEGLKLLHSLESLRSDDFFLSVKLAYYIDIIRHIIFLSMNTLEQMGNLNESSQQVIRDNLTQLKNQWLVRLFGLADRIEDEALLAPGTVSLPLMKSVKPLYKILIEYTSKVVNFTTKGQELLTIEDDKFVNLRLEETQQRISKAQQNMVKIDQAKQAFIAFFNILEKSKYIDLNIIELPEDIKKELIKQYKLLESYFKQLDIELNNNTINALTKESLWFRTINPWHWLPSSHENTKVIKLLLLKPKLQALLTRDTATQQFHIQLNEDLIQSVRSKAELSIYPYAGETNIFSCDEAVVLKMNKNPTDFELSLDGESCLLRNTDTLNSLQTFALYQFYMNKLDNLARAKKAYDKFVDLIKVYHSIPLNDLDSELKANLRNLYSQFQPYLVDDLARAKKAYDIFLKLIQKYPSIALNDLDSELKAKLRYLYFQFQPYFIDAFATDNRIFSIDAAIVNCDDRQANQNRRITTNLFLNISPTLHAYFKGTNTVDAAIVNSLSANGSTATQQNNSITTNHFFNVHQPILASITKADSLWRCQAGKYFALAHNKYRETAYANPLEPDEKAGVRAHYFIKHREYSNAVAEFRESLFQLTTLFNRATRDQLEPVRATIPFIAPGLPFPELKDKYKIQTQCKQVISIKRIFNALYHLEQMSAQLEKLNDKSTETFYVYLLIKVYNHVNEILNLAKDLYKDPHLSLLATDLEDKAKVIFQTLLERSEPYRDGHETVVLANTSNTIQYGGIWYTLHAFMLIPEHVSALSSQSELSAQDLREIRTKAKQTVVKIEGIIASSDSYFKLFLKTPVMYSLFQELKVKLSQFTTISHDAVLTHLEEINTYLFTQILLETDQWEDKLGLKPGQLSGPMKTLLDEFYKGMVEPLGFTSQKHFALISSLKPLEQRQANVAMRKRLAEAEQEAINSDYLIMEELTKSSKCYTNLTIGAPPESSIAIHIAKHRLIAAYRKAIPTLDKHQALIDSLPPVDVEKSPAVDNLLNPLLQSETLYRTNIEAQSQIVFSYYQGLVNTHQLDIDTAKEKIAYLDKLKTKLELEKQQFVIDYTKKAIDRRIEFVLRRHIGLLHMRTEYNEKLKEYLISYQQSFIESASSADDIDKMVQDTITAKVKHFDHNNFQDYLHLESVMASLTQFKTYFNEASIAIQDRRSLFENELTLANKSGLVTKLEEVTLNANLPVNARVNAMKKMVGEYQFEATMLAHVHPTPLTFAWLSQMVTYFLRLLHVYKPQYIEQHEQLNTAINTVPDKKQLSRYRVFESEPEPQRRYDLPPLPKIRSTDNNQEPTLPSATSAS